MDRHEDRRREEALDRAAWMKAYRAARIEIRRGAGARSLAGESLAARLAADSRMADLDFRAIWNRGRHHVAGGA